MSIIKNTPVGGTLINRVLPEAEARAWASTARDSIALILADFEVTDLFQIALGGYSPLTGFLAERNYLSVLERGRLADLTPWTIPITLSVTDDEAASLSEGQFVALLDSRERLLGRLQVASVYQRNLELEARAVFGTNHTDDAHPGVARLRKAGKWLVAGPIEVVPDALPEDYNGLEYRPAAIRAEIERRGWKRVVAFQTRNPIHRAHEYLLRTALETADGLLIHPLVGETKSDDLPAEVRVEAYHALIDTYFPKDRVILAALPVAMRYAGPKEAIHHALIRRNYGATDFIVGRDHAGVGSYYGTYDAQRAFDTYEPGELGITNLNFEHSFYDTRLGEYATSKTSTSGLDDRLIISGTKVRELLSNGEYPPPEIVRPEIARILIAHYQSLQPA